MNLPTRTLSLTFCAAASLTLTALSFTQDTCPHHAVKVIVALASVGSVEMIARQISQLPTTDFYQPFVVDNQADGSEQIGVPVVAKAA